MFELRSLCRTCGTNLENLRSTKLFDKSNYELINLIENITDMFLEFDNYMPELICQRCKMMLDRMLEFRKKCLDVHQFLVLTKKKEIQKGDTSSEAIGDAYEEVEKYILQEDDGEELLDVEESLDAIEDIEIVLQEDDDEELYEVQAELEQQERERKQQSLELEQERERNQPKLELEQDNLDDPHPPDSPKTRRRTEARRARQARRSGKTWICDQCGGEFKCSTYLKLHLRRHTGDKPFECDICQAKYYTENEMRRHRILHSDARPYACRFCPKTFRGCSSKVVHERTHTNERPFPCRYCDKAFTSTSSRQRHEMLHTSGRKFHCETCDQWFLRSSHLTLHASTKLHRRRAANATSV
ncbi:hypothetical protein KR009_012220 [Drosophila setifemur]|nr:hypothetical protein KR009_012220 [Drosophila setifemur]